MKICKEIQVNLECVCDYIVGCMTSDAFPQKRVVNKLMLRKLLDQFNYEYNNWYKKIPCARMPLQDRLADWLSGLPINICYTYADIEQMAKQLGMAYTFCNGNEWFDFLACCIIELAKLYDIEIE